MPPVADNVTTTELSHDTLLFNAAGNITGVKGRSSAQRFFEEGTDGLCYSRVLASRGGLLSLITTGQGCPGGVNSF